MPNFGDETADGDTFPDTPDRTILSKFTLTENGTITSITVRFDAASTSGNNFKGLIYAADGAAGIPGTRKAIGASVAVPAGGGNLQSDVSPGVDLVAGDYWLGSVTSDSNPTWQCDVSGDLSRMEGCTFASPPTPWTESGTSVARCNVFATYSTAAGATIFGYSESLIRKLARVLRPRVFKPGRAR